MHNIFLSHISEEAPVATVIKDWVESTFAGQCTVFVSSSPQDLRPGEKWLDQIDAALGTAEVLLVLCSRISVTRPWINFETGYAWSRKIPVIPVCHSALSKGQLPQPMAQFQALDVTDPDFAVNLISGLAQLLQITKLPRISYANMMKELEDAEARIPKAAPDSMAGGPLQEDDLTRVKTEEIEESLEDLSPTSQRLLITTGLTADNEPVDSVSSVTLDVAKVYFYVYWFELIPNKEYVCTWQLFDEGEEILSTKKLRFTPNGSVWNTWSPYTLKKSIDKPGRWKIVISLNGRKAIEKSFRIADKP